MENNTTDERIITSAGAALLIGVAMMLVTMVLHPTGGNMEHILHITKLAIITHSIAIASVPFTIFGFWGLTKKLWSEPILSIFAFITMAVALFAVIWAAAVNGLALPFFLSHYRDAPPETILAIKPILKYNMSLNQAFDFIYMGASCLAMVSWSVAILKTNVFPKWIAYVGLLITMVVVGLLVAGLSLVDLNGFRIFIVGFVIWIVIIAIHLQKK